MKTKRALVDSRTFEVVAEGGDLPKDTEHYFSQVLRLGVGNRVEVGDGSGRLVRGNLSASKGGLCISNRRIETVPENSQPPITLIAALLKQKRWQLLVEKAVEVGANRLVPVITERTTVRPSPEKAELARARWAKLAREAGKQCKRTTVCRVERVVSLPQALAEPGFGTRLFLTLADAPPIVPLLQASNDVSEFVVAIGPEGGFTEAEEALAHRYDFLSASLGGYPLRAETAAVVALGLIRNLG